MVERKEGREGEREGGRKGGREGRRKEGREGGKEQARTLAKCNLVRTGQRCVSAG